MVHTMPPFPNLFPLLLWFLSWNILAEGKPVYFVTRPFTDLVLDENYAHPEPTFARNGENFYNLPLGEDGRRELHKDPCDQYIEGKRFNTYDQFAYRPGGVSPIGDATLIVGNDNKTVVICKRVYIITRTPTGVAEEVYEGENEVYNITATDNTYWREIFSQGETCEGFCLSRNFVCRFSTDVDTCTQKINNAHRFGDRWWQLENVDGDTAVGPDCNDEQACLDGSSGISVLLALYATAIGSIVMTFL